MSEWKYGELDDKDVLSRIEGHFIQPLLSAPAQTIKATTKTLELVGSRSNMEVKRMKQLSKSILDAEEREKTYGVSWIFVVVLKLSVCSYKQIQCCRVGSGGEWRKWVKENILNVNGVPLHQATS